MTCLLFSRHSVVSLVYWWHYNGAFISQLRTLYTDFYWMPPFFFLLTNSIPANVNVLTLTFPSRPEHCGFHGFTDKTNNNMKTETFSLLLHITMHNTVSATVVTSSPLSWTPRNSIRVVAWQSLLIHMEMIINHLQYCNIFLSWVLGMIRRFYCH